MRNNDIIIIGHPRSGTGWASKVCQAAGLRVGHERLKRDGISSWMWAAKEAKVPWGHGYKETVDPIIVYLVRDIDDTLASVYHTESESIPWRAEVLGVKERELVGQHGAMKSMELWYKMAQRKWPRLQVVRLDEFSDYIRTLTGKNFTDPPPHNVREHGPAALFYDVVKDPEIKQAYDDAKGRARETALLPHYAEHLDHRSWVNEDMLKMCLEATVKAEGPLPFYDVGCGNGRGLISARNLGHHPVGIDYSEDRVFAARKNSGVPVIEGDAHHIDRWVGFVRMLKDFEYGRSTTRPVFGLFEVLEHLDNPRQVIEAAREHGSVVGSVPLNHEYHAHLNVWRNKEEVVKELGVNITIDYKDRVWFGIS